MPDSEVCPTCGGTGQLPPESVVNVATGQVTTVYPPCTDCLPW